MASNLVPSQLMSFPKDATPTIPNNPSDPCQPLSLKTFRNIKELKQLHGNLTKTGSIKNPSALIKLLSTSSKMGSFETWNYSKEVVIKQLEKIKKMGNQLRIWNSLIRGYSLFEKGEEALSVYLKMVVQGVLPDDYTYPNVLNACTKTAAFKEGIQLHGSAIKMGFDSSLYMANCLIHFYIESGDMCSAQRVFDEMNERDVVSWTSLVSGYVRGGFPKAAVHLFFQMMESGVTPNSFTLTSVISACAKTRDLEFAKKVCGHINDCGVELDQVLMNALVDMYMNCGAIETAKRFFDECKDKNLVLYNTVMTNFVREGMAKEAILVFREMLDSGVLPDTVTMLAVISASAILGNLVFGTQCHGYILRNGFDSWDPVMNSFIDMYMKCGKLDMACRVFDLMLNKTITSWNTMISGYVRNGDMESALQIFSSMPQKDLVSWNTMIGSLVQEYRFEEAIELFRVMPDESVKGDRVTMLAVASACGNLCDLDLAKWVHTYIIKNEIKCDMLLNTTLVDMYARCGDPTSSIQVFDKMDEKDVPAWNVGTRAMAMVGNNDRAAQVLDDKVVENEITIMILDLDFYIEINDILPRFIVWQQPITSLWRRRFFSSQKIKESIEVVDCLVQLPLCAQVLGQEGATLFHVTYASDLLQSWSAPLILCCGPCQHDIFFMIMLI